MPGFREVQEALLLAYDDNLLDGDDFILLYNLNRSKNPKYKELTADTTKHSLSEIVSISII